MTTQINYRVSTFLNVGLQAKWGRTRLGAPIIFAKTSNQKAWYAVTHSMFEDMKKEGVKEAFERHTLLGDIFSIEA